MYVETKLSEQAKALEKALCAVPPMYDTADEIFSKYYITPEELSKIACNLMDVCFDEQFPCRDSLKELVEDKTVCSYIYRVMQYLFSKGYDPNVVVDDGCECAMTTIRFLSYPEGLAPKLMRLFMENGGNPNLVVEGESVFEDVDFAVSYDEYFSRSAVYCWLVLMAYGGRLGKKRHLPLTMHDNLDVSIFKRFEDYAYYEIIPTKQKPGYYGCWNMLIYDTRIDERVKVVASYGDLNREPEDAPLIKDSSAERYEAKADNSQKTGPKEIRPDVVPISEEDFLRKIEKMYSEYVMEDIYCHMESDFRYSSVWVFSDITSAKEYVEYIIGKIQTLKKINSVIKTKMMHIQGSRKPCLILEQSPNIEPACLTVERSANGLIARMDMAPSSFYKLNF